MENEKINILLVDDRPENLLTLEAILDHDDYHLIKVQSGEDALKYLLKHDVALILLDVQMPGLDGYSTAKIIKAREKTKHVPILFITANYLDSEHVFMGYTVGAIDYILKPFDPIILASKVERFVELYKLRKQLEHQTNTLIEKNNVIQYLANHDSLTELPNRRYFYELLIAQVNEAKLKNETFSVMILDLDRFKYVNDSLGHVIGDNLLIEVAKRLYSSTRAEDFIARVGGDEFYIILPNSDRDQSIKLAENILDSFKNPFLIDKYEFYITSCIGLAIFPYDAEDSNSLIQKADAALYRAKEQGKNKYNVFHSGMNIQSYRSFLLQNDLRKAIDNNEFFLVYQPKVNIHSGQVKSAEALLRWKHPVWGLIPPNEFIPLAEESGLIFEIDQWVFKNVCKQIQTWNNNQVEYIRIAVNLSAKHFVEKNFIQNIIQVIDEFQIETMQLEFEITETALLANEESIKQTLKQIKELGIHISLDDYGTGYSSIIYLRNFPLDSIKIDQSYINDLPNNMNNSVEIVESIINLAKKLNITVIAEGVETVEQLEILNELQCKEVQGYIYSPPISSENLVEYVQNDDSKILTKINDPKPLSIEQKNKIKPFESGTNSHVLQNAISELKGTYSLSSRELDVLTLIVEGLTNKEISERLFISEHTVKNHITNILHKFDATDRVQVISRVYEACINVV
ncbi:EAL domain-containing protein [Ureibacillus acetophenoni]|uniref:Response regulator receiver modulated diguanylate cyclase/phosphodiesterase n=1 Tax=Ureibacillus acetophenoni TaxID=614649 RepID=A0A285U7F9_9BACL|nr:EAL domain-containing protein [Ureibacillus acetophenoni]SOC37338.1 response regulator receiver modulated diguanylate cyclase/phosphodiesterase [Ureibacillus acetophenoni]